MLCNVDAKQLEWIVAAYLSQDEVAINEIRQGLDLHADNQKRFNLPSRVVAKVLLFRTIYGGTGYSFANDPEFGYLGSEGWWDEKITEFYAKYKGLYAWHERLYERVVRDNGRLVLPTGRVYQFQVYHNRNGEVRYHRPIILNYPVQGLADDLMKIARVSLWKRLHDPRWYGSPAGILFVNSVHDSIILDIESKVWDNDRDRIVKLIQCVFEDVPKNFKNLFDIEFNLPVRCEITYGMDWKNMSEIK